LGDAPCPASRQSLSFAILLSPVFLPIGKIAVHRIERMEHANRPGAGCSSRMCECFEVVTPEAERKSGAGPVLLNNNTHARVFLLGFQKRVHHRSNSPVTSIAIQGESSMSLSRRSILALMALGGSAPDSPSVSHQRNVVLANWFISG
jgi:hypothetical protein